MSVIPPGDVLRLPDVKKRTGLSKSEIYRRMADGVFPKQHRLSARVAVWLETEVDRYMAGLFTAAGSLQPAGLDDLL